MTRTTGDTPSEAARGARRVVAGAGRAWLALTADERKAVVVVLALFLLGLAVRYWHLRRVREMAARPVAEAVLDTRGGKQGEATPRR